jgi:hypothetical protein
MRIAEIRGHVPPRPASKGRTLISNKPAPYLLSESGPELVPDPRNQEQPMQHDLMNDISAQAWLELVALNMRLWRPEVADWLHSEAATAPLKQLLAVVPCPPEVH